MLSETSTKKKPEIKFSDYVDVLTHNRPLQMMTLGIGAVGAKFGLKKAMQMGSWGVIVMDAIAIAIWFLLDPKTLNLPGLTNGYGQDFNGLTVFTVLLFLVTVVGGGYRPESTEHRT